MSDQTDREELIVWAECLEAYARDWDSTFTSTTFFTQEFWYLFTHSLLAFWRGEDFTLSTAMNKMKSGGQGTKRARIARAKDAGLLILQEKGAKGDARATLVKPTAKLEALMTEHLRRTRAKVRGKFEP